MEITTEIYYFIFLRFGLIGILLISFLAATILPLSSEIFVGIAYHFFPQNAIWIYASMGNSLGCIFNYYLGIWFYRNFSQIQIKIAKIKFHLPDEKEWSYKIFKKNSYFSLILSWLPFVGDPITILAGYFKISLPIFIFFVIPLRVIRYYILIYLLS